ncbi:efflux RND transporter periplasmic adaptor subunit [Wenzhouxiangella sp. AB-CW3]|uniref:efflux RND transporter periplasmic adaptor subunit n=1 Tax=Wenzhouxiangella sp. AB-CW3 TaxID=2771012 RepID=UPI00168B263F|nr:HlyD family efflux transporter periplasmic adaptor subunit [Wenzhouxiangella sp. AB-CW3]QOC22779.1 efflux RND transporter periplasmic adaptor subunit [Wenzhouxiangella sp. AB-CW3]
MLLALMLSNPAVRTTGRLFTGCALTIVLTVGLAVASDEGWVGVVYPAEAVKVSSELDGTVEEVEVLIGQPVIPGQQLAVINLEELKSEIARSEAELRMAKAQVTEENSMRSLRKSELDRRYMAGASVSLDELGMAEQLYEAAKAGVASAKAQLEAVKADHELLLLKQQRTSVVAPIGGLVQQRRVRKGDRIRTGDVMFEIVKPDSLLVRFAFPESDRYNVQVGDKMLIDASATATVVAVAPGSDVVTGLVVAEASLESEEIGLLGRGVSVQPLPATNSAASDPVASR